MCPLIVTPVCNFSLHQRKPSGDQLYRPELHDEKEDGALERGNGADRTVTTGQMPCSLFIPLRLYESWSHTEAKAQ